jgi:hypothetical protein
LGLYSLLVHAQYPPAERNRTIKVDLVLGERNTMKELTGHVERGFG